MKWEMARRGFPKIPLLEVEMPWVRAPPARTRRDARVPVYPLSPCPLLPHGEKGELGRPEV